MSRKPSAPEGADGFLDTFRQENFYYLDKDTQDRTTLSAGKGRPLAVRRRGGATHPVYSAAESLLRAKEGYRNAKLTQKPSMRSGAMQSEFFADLGRKVIPLLTIIFAEGQHETTISAVTFPPAAVFDEAGCQALRVAASLQ